MSFDLWDYYDGHKLLIKHAHQRHRKVYISGAKMAIVENDIVQITDQDNDEITLIDHQTKRFARMTMRAAKELDQKGFESLGTGMRMNVVESEVPDTWNGIRVRRTLIVAHVPAAMSGLPADSEIRITQLTTTELPGWHDVMERLRGHDARFDQELDALIQTMAASDLQNAKDVQAARAKVQTLALPVRSVSEVRLAPQSWVGNAVADLVGKSLMRIEEEISGLRGDPVDQSIFLGPPSDYEPMELKDMYQVRAQRNGMF
jgi:hypothetical protein